MSTAEGVRELLLTEPWRARQGQPRSILDLDWTEEPQACVGEIVYEGASDWWWCKDCGYCSCWSTTAHNKPEHPDEFYANSLKFFYKQRQKQGMTHEAALGQARHLQGVVLRIAAKLGPEELARYINEHVLIE